MQTCFQNRIKSSAVLGAAAFLFAAAPLFAGADVLGDQQRFLVDKSYDVSQREEVDTVLRVANSSVYFYVEKDWWNSLSSDLQALHEQALIDLGKEFEQTIYPTLTQTFGLEWKPGIDGDEVLTVLLHQMREDAGGYTNLGDEFPKVQNPKSNEREMMYLNTSFLGSQLAKGFLAHEFAHLITFNQKNRLRGVDEEVWLNEVRAEYAPTLLRYDTVFEDSALKRRMRSFLQDPDDALLEWKNTAADYGVANMFAQYLVDHYGIQLLVDSLKSNKAGIEAVNDALAQGKFQENFTDVFSNWQVALVLNDCSYGERFCYHNPHLVNLRIAPQTNFLPGVGDSTLSLSNITKDWTGKWVKVIGGKDILSVDFRGASQGTFRVPYLLEDVDRKFSAHTLELDAQNTGSIVLSDFSTETRSVTFLPLAVTQLAPYTASYPDRSFSFVISASEDTQKEEEERITQLLSQIEDLKKQIATLQAQLAAAQSRAVTNGCDSFERSLSWGVQDTTEVKCLQEFLRSQGPEIYPEGLVTGNFLSLTQAAVIHFQEKYAAEILEPLGLKQGTGYVGSSTRAKINSLLNP